MSEAQREQMQPEENRTFDQIVVALQDHLGVTRQDVLDLFRRTIHSGESGAWSISLEAGKIAIVGKDSGVRYRIGIQTIKQLDRESQTLKPRDIPTLICQNHQPNTTKKNMNRAEGAPASQ